ncbi:MAG TPA: DUF3131 domain-containing protein [Gemmatimonadaceae bacterium]|nr:DUF3131 domain-containing protein [Gemmatimonadaceae bacterium]
MRSRKYPIVFSLMMGAVAATSACSNGGQQPVPGAIDTAPAAAPPPIVPVVVTPQERQLYLDAARTSWNFVNRITEPSTGLARAHANYSYVTLWDIAGVIAANYTAHELAFIDDATYDAHIQRILATLSTVDLFDKAAYNRIYDAKTGRMVDNASKISNLGAGWSSVDIGRLLVWLRIVSTKQPKYMPLATQVVRRLNMSKLLDDGFLRGLEVDPKTGKQKTFTEDEIGYQQYALYGFAMWGAKVNPDGLDVRKNVAAINVLGVRLLISSPGNDRVMSEPFIMLGMETGFRTADIARQAAQVLAAQTARYQRTRIVTAVTEDALPDPPYYFYYYSVYHRGNPFVVESLDDKVFQSPRWVSSKAAFGWNAVLPNAYTQLVMRTVRPAGTPNGWGSGVYEDTLQPTGVPSLNTAALIMESALYKTRGRPILAN